MLKLKPNVIPWRSSSSTLSRQREDCVYLIFFHTTNCPHEINKLHCYYINCLRLLLFIHSLEPPIISMSSCWLLPVMCNNCLEEINIFLRLQLGGGALKSFFSFLSCSSGYALISSFPAGREKKKSQLNITQDSFISITLDARYKDKRHISTV